MFDPAGTGRWAEVAHVESFPCEDGVTIGPPSWRRLGKGVRYILTAEGGRAGRHRIAVGKQGAAGRLITGIEYVLGARYLGERGLAPDLRPACGKGGPGSVLTLPLTVVAALMGEDDPTENEAARKRLDRAIETARPQYQSGPGRHDTAPAASGGVAGARFGPVRRGGAAGAVGRRKGIRDGDACGLAWARPGRAIDRPAIRNRPSGNNGPEIAEYAAIQARSARRRPSPMDPYGTLLERRHFEGARRPEKATSNPAPETPDSVGATP